MTRTMGSKRQGKNHNKPATSIDAQREALAEAERKLKAEIARRQRLIDEAPKIARELEKQRQNEFVRRKSRVEPGVNRRGALPDPRHGPYNSNVIPAGRDRRLRREQRRGMLTFFVLLFTFAGILTYIYFAMLRGG